MKVKELRDYLNKVAEIRPEGLEEEITLIVTDDDNVFLVDGSLDRIESGRNPTTLESYGMCLIGEQKNKLTDPICLD